MMDLFMYLVDVNSMELKNMISKIAHGQVRTRNLVNLFSQINYQKFNILSNHVGLATNLYLSKFRNIQLIVLIFLELILNLLFLSLMQLKTLSFLSQYLLI